MNLDWQTLLDQNGVPYVTTGPNVSKGNLAVKCPFCSDDPSEHLVIRVNGKGWWCWRNRNHRGSSPVPLVAALLHLSQETARVIVGDRDHVPVDLQSRVQQIMEPREEPMVKELTLLPEFQRLTRARPSCLPFLRYLKHRGFNNHKALTPYRLRYATSGHFRYRVIFPVYFKNKLVSWTGRAITPYQSPRYLTLDRDEGIGPITNYVLWYDLLMSRRGDAIYLVEGPFDALKIDTFMRDDHVRATCCFTSSPTPTQIALLHKLLPRYGRRYILLDEGTAHVAMTILPSLTGLDVKVRFLPRGVKDPGELDLTTPRHRNFLLAHT